MIDDLLRNDCFHLEIDGVSAGGFLHCSGLGGEVSVFEFTEGGTMSPRKFPDERAVSNVVLERGVVRSQELYSWFVKGDSRDGAIVLLNADGREEIRWELKRAWPCRWSGPSLDARESAVAVEWIELVHEGCEWNPR